MAKRSDTTETVMLVLQLLQRIPRGRKVTASELQLQLEAAGKAKISLRLLFVRHAVPKQRHRIKELF